MKSKRVAGEYLVQKSNEILEKYGFKLDPQKRKDILYYVVRDNLGFGKINPLMHDPFIEDISCDGVKRSPLHLAQKIRIHPHQLALRNGARTGLFCA